MSYQRASLSTDTTSFSLPFTDLDFENATHSQLIRLRKDDLVRLCETRSLDIAGTKPQLAQALLEWVSISFLSASVGFSTLPY